MILVGVVIMSIKAIWKVCTNRNDCPSGVYEVIDRQAEHRQVELVIVTRIGLAMYKCALASLVA